MKVRSTIALGLTVLVILLVALLAFNGVKYGLYMIEPIGRYIPLGMDLGGGGYAVLAMNDSGIEVIAEDTPTEDTPAEDAATDESAAEPPAEDAVPAEGEEDTRIEEAMAVIEKRLEYMGFERATVIRQGDNRIRVELPATERLSSVASALSAKGHLEFVDPDGNNILTGAEVKNTAAGYQDATLQTAAVAFEFNAAGTEAFATATANNIGKTISIKLDGSTLFSPTIDSAIPNGMASISVSGASGEESLAYARELAATIRSGELPVGFKVESQGPISATLGADAPGSLALAGICIFAIILLMMALIYRLPGLMADLSLCVYGLAVAYAFALIPGVQLNLPGLAAILIAGIMVADVNCIIFERFREEHKSGFSITDSMKFGIGKTLGAVKESNIMIGITALVLMMFGTDTIRGFGIALLIGIAAAFIITMTLMRFLLQRVVRLGIKNNAMLMR